MRQIDGIVQLDRLVVIPYIVVYLMGMYILLTLSYF